MTLKNYLHHHISYKIFNVKQNKFKYIFLQVHELSDIYYI